MPCSTVSHTSNGEATAMSDEGRYTDTSAKMRSTDEMYTELQLPQVSCGVVYDWGHKNISGWEREET